jgi:hypothetical protein
MRLADNGRQVLSDSLSGRLLSRERFTNSAHFPVYPGSDSLTV